MDISETYIKMCDCPEIQGQHRGNDPIGFLVWRRGSRKLICGKCEEYVESDFCPKCGSASEFEEGVWTLNQFNAIGPYRDGIWLPRQDQLQEMVNPPQLRGIISLELIGAFHGFCRPMKQYRRPPLVILEEDDHSEEAQRIRHEAYEEASVILNPEQVAYPAQFTSMEQLWLAFVMKERHNKVWNGESWQ